jgi:8-oxo-dGTP pyrophosphatase MutT (NUDIX family)
MEADNVIEKVTAFVTRLNNSAFELLLFKHPNAGIQIPAGTVEENEELDSAVMREIAEETGLKNVTIKQYIGYLDEKPPNAMSFIMRKTKVYSRPDSSSFDWAEFRRGLPVKPHHKEGEFTQVTYQEWDKYPNPQYVTYSITGWVRSDLLCRKTRRHFFHLAVNGDVQETRMQFADNHCFQLFWAPFSSLPAIVEPQRYWIGYVRNILKYDFGC